MDMTVMCATSCTAVAVITVAVIAVSVIAVSAREMCVHIGNLVFRVAATIMHMPTPHHGV